MTRDKLIALIRELAEEVKRERVGVKMLSGARLDAHLANQSDVTLRRTRRVYEEMLEEYKRVGASPSKRHKEG
jgi:hypothetical protein